MLPWLQRRSKSLEQGADLHIAQLMPLPLTVSCFSKIQINFTFLVPAHLGSPEQRAVKRGIYEQRHNGCEQFASDCYPAVSRLRFEPRPFCA